MVILVVDNGSCEHVNIAEVRGQTNDLCDISEILKHVNSNRVSVSNFGGRLLLFLVPVPGFLSLFTTYNFVILRDWVPILFNLCPLCIPLLACLPSFLPLLSGSPSPWFPQDRHLALLFKVLSVPSCLCVSSVASLSHVSQMSWFMTYLFPYVTPCLVLLSVSRDVIMFCSRCVL